MSARPEPALGGLRVDGPTRTCIGCRRRSATDTLMRITATDDGELLVGRRLPGRGAWVCPIETCVAMARRRKAFARALRRSLADGADDRFVAWFAGISGGTTMQTLDAVDAIDIASPASSGAGQGALVRRVQRP